MAQNEDVRIALLDDHNIFLDGLKMLLSTQDWLEIVGTYTNAEAAFKAVDLLKIDVVITDLRMPGTDGVSFIRQAHQDHPELRFIALTMIKEPSMVFETLEAGADAYLLKNTHLDELTAAIKAVTQGETFISPAINGLMVNRLQEEKRNTPDLSNREREVLGYLSHGLSSKLIAAELNLSIDTIKFHRKNLLSKLNQPNVAALVSYAHAEGLLRH